MAHPFDPLPLAADHLHARRCGTHHLVAGRDCLLARGLAQDWMAELHAAGLAPVPRDAISFLERRLDDLAGHQHSQDHGFAQDPSWDRHRAQSWIELRFADGHVERLGPMLHWQAELFMGTLPFDRPSDCVGAMIIAEGAWVRALLDDLGAI